MSKTHCKKWANYARIVTGSTKQDPKVARLYDEVESVKTEADARTFYKKVRKYLAAEDSYYSRINLLKRKGKQVGLTDKEGRELRALINLGMF